MAQYINKEIVCEAYVHLEVDDSFTSEKITEIENELKAFFDARVKFLLGDSVQTSIETEPGSLKVKLRAVAGIAALLGTAAISYPTFRDGIKAFYDDSRMLAEATNLETVFITRTQSCDRLHSEARTGVIGKIAKLVSAIETLNGKAKGLAAPSNKIEIKRIRELTTSLDGITSDIQHLLGKIQSNEDRFCVAQGLHETLSQMPEVLPAETELSKSNLKRAVLRQSDLLIPAESEMQRYTFALKTAKQILKKIGLASKPLKA